LNRKTLDDVFTALARLNVKAKTARVDYNPIADKNKSPFRQRLARWGVSG
jgi:hypothetical protein